MNNNAIHSTSLSYRYEDIKTVDETCFTIDKGEIIGFIGSNNTGQLDFTQNVQPP